MDPRAVREAQERARLHQIPRRYEETRTFTIKDLSHERITDIGEKILNKLKAQHNAEIELAVKETEKNVWKAAEDEKKITLEKKEETAILQCNKTVNTISKKFEKIKQKDAYRAELAMQKALIEQLKLFQEEAEKTKMISLTKLQQKCDEEKKKAIEAAKIEQASIDAEKTKQVAKEAEEKLKSTLKEFEIQIQETLRMQAAEQEKKNKEEMNKDRQEIHKASLGNAEEIKIKYDKQLEMLQEDLKVKQIAVEEMKFQINKLKEEKSDISETLSDAKRELLNLISLKLKMEPSQGKYLILPRKPN